MTPGLVNLPGFGFLVVIILVVVIFVASLVLVLKVVIFLEVVVDFVADVKTAHKEFRGARLFSHDAGSVVGFGLSRLGGGYVDQK